MVVEDLKKNITQFNLEISKCHYIDKNLESKF